MNRRQWTFAVATLAATPWASASPPYPSRPIRLIYNFAPGGPGDAVARDLAARMSGLLGQPIVVENVSGGGGAVGILATARAPGDGYTLLFAALTGIVQVPLVTGNGSFDPFRSVAPIANVGSAPLALIVSADVPADDFPSFAAWARKQPAGVDVGGAGPIMEVATKMLAREAGLNLVWVPYRGAAPALQAVLAKETKSTLQVPSAMLTEYIKTGKVKVIGVTSAQPSALLPGVAPIANHIPNYVQDINFVLWSPPGLPPATAGKIDAALAAVLAQPDMSARLEANGMVKNHGTPAEVGRITRRENDNIRKVLETASIHFGG